jgi:hypothetical protein
MAKRKTKSVDQILGDLNRGSNQARRNALRDLCPCRNNGNRDVEVWNEIFDKARHGALQERNRAAHAIGTLLEKSIGNPEWRAIVRRMQPRLDDIMSDMRASRLLLAQLKKHGHMRRGVAMQNYCHVRRVIDMATPAELAKWLNERALAIEGANGLTANDPGLQRLWRWLRHRVKFQPKWDTSDAELTRVARRFLPWAFRRWHDGVIAARLPGRCVTVVPVDALDSPDQRGTTVAGGEDDLSWVLQNCLNVSRGGIALGC